MAASSPSGYSAIDKFVNFAVLSRVTAVFLQVRDLHFFSVHSAVI